MAPSRLTLGFAAVADFQGVIAQETLRGVTQACVDHDVNLVNFVGSVKSPLSEDGEFFDHHLLRYRFMHVANLDGLVSWASSLRVKLDPRAIVDLHRGLGPLPLVTLGVPVYDPAPGVITRSADGIEVLVDHLVGHHGYRRLGFVGVEGFGEFDQRLEAFGQALGRRGLNLDPAHVWKSPSLADHDVRRTADQVCAALGREATGPQVLVTVSDQLAQGLVAQLALNGFRVPQDVCVTGFNNQGHGPGTVPLTTVDLAFYEKGYRAVTLVLEVIRAQRTGRPRPTTVVLPSRLVVRQSCGCFEDSSPRAEAGAWAGIVARALDSDRKAGGTALVSTIRDAFGSTTAPFRDEEAWHELLSSLRPTPQDRAAGADTAAWEDLVHQARVQVSRLARYTVVAHRGPVGALAHFALDLAAASEVTTVVAHLSRHLTALGIPGHGLTLFDWPQKHLASGTLLPPGRPLPDGRWTTVMAVLYHQGCALGIAQWEMGPPDVALYDTVRTLVSHALYRVSVTEGRRVPGASGARLDADAIVAYLGAHLGPTDLGAFARDLGLSRSHLAKRTRQLTGYSVQHLHTVLKVDQAKVLLAPGTLRVSEVASRLGYSSPFYFSKVFHRYTGLSPRQWTAR